MSIKQLVAKFEQQALAAEDFNHLAHLQVAWHYLCHFPYEEAREKFHQGITSLSKKLSAPEKYHLTLSDFFLQYLQQVKWFLATSDWQKVARACPLLINDGKKLVGYYYSEQLINSEKARAAYVEGDKLVLNRASLKFSEQEYPVYDLQQHESPVIVSIPHNGQFVPHSVLKQMSSAALDSADTDWYLSQLYDFLKQQKVSTISANYSRYLIDLNRDISGKQLYANADNTELCPTSCFNFEPLYQSGKLPTEQDIAQRVESYWKPYHQQLANLIEQAKAKFGFVILFEAHSIASQVPRFFEGSLPDFNFGTNDEQTLNRSLNELVKSFDTKPYSKIINGRFKGGYITRHYADPNNNIFTVQLELSQATYMDEQSNRFATQKAQKVSKVIEQLLAGFVGFALNKK